jgi:hypothetical protein
MKKAPLLTPNLTVGHLEQHLALLDKFHSALPANEEEKDAYLTRAEYRYALWVKRVLPFVHRGCGQQYVPPLGIAIIYMYIHIYQIVRHHYIHDIHGVA